MLTRGRLAIGNAVTSMERQNGHSHLHPCDVD